MRRPLKAVVFDMDGTLTPVRSVWQHIHEYLGTWETHGLPSLNAFLAGRITYREFADRDVAAWRGVPRARLEEAVAAIPLRPGVPELVSALRERGCRLAVLSSGLDLLVRRVADPLGFELCLCNELGFSAGVIDGRVTINVGWDGKPEQLPVICRRFGVMAAEVAMVGDGSGDAAVFPLVGFGVAFNADPEVEARADAAVRHEDARALLPVLLPRLAGEEEWTNAVAVR